MSRIVKAPMRPGSHLPTVPKPHGAWRAMVSDTLASLHEPPSAPEQVRARLQATANPRVPNLEKAVRARLHLGKANNDVPGRDPHSR